MIDEKAQGYANRLSQLESERTQWESIWRELNAVIEPEPDVFTGNYRAQGGGKLNSRVYDSTATLALPEFAAGIESVVTPRTSQWHTLSTTNYILDQNPNVKLYFQQCTDILFAVRYSSKANFTSQMNQIYKSLGKYGTACLFVDDVPGYGIVYKTIDIAELYIQQNYVGFIDTVFRKFEYTVKQAIDAWGIENMPDLIANSIDSKPNDKHTFIHIVEPSKGSNRKFDSTYICLETKTTVSTGRYTTMPYCVCRYQVAINEVYGRSPGMNILPDIKMIQEVVKLDLNARQLNIMPPLMAPADGTLSPFNMIPGAINYGFVNNNQPSLIPLQTGAQIDVSDSLIQRLENKIQIGFSIPLFQMLTQATGQMTATEVLLRNQEKAALLAPAAGRIQTELLGNMIEREIDILYKLDLLPPMPDELKDIHGYYEVNYTGPLNQIQRSSESVSMLTLINNIGTIAQFNPDVIKLIDFEAVLRKLADIGNVPVDVIRTPEMIAAMQQAEAQQQQLNNVLQAAPQVASSAKDLAQAQQIYNQPSPGIPNG